MEYRGSVEDSPGVGVEEKETRWTVLRRTFGVREVSEGS